MMKKNNQIMETANCEASKESQNSKKEQLMQTTNDNNNCDSETENTAEKFGELLQKFKSVAHNFITAFIESQLYDSTTTSTTQSSVPKIYNLKLRIKLMNHILMKFNDDIQKQLQEEVLSTMCHLICHQRRIYKTSNRCDNISTCNPSEILWTCREDGLQHLENLITKLKSQFNFDRKNLRGVLEEQETSLNYTDAGNINNSQLLRPKSPRVNPNVHYENVVTQILQQSPNCNHNNNAQKGVYDATIMSHDGRKPFKIKPPHSESDSQSAGDFSYHMGLYDANPDERKQIECKISAAQLKSRNGLPFQIRPFTLSRYNKMNEITTFQNFEDSLLSYTMMSKCVPLLWCGRGPDNELLLYPSGYNCNGDCSNGMMPSCCHSGAMGKFSWPTSKNLLTDAEKTGMNANFNYDDDGTESDRQRRSRSRKRNEYLENSSPTQVNSSETKRPKKFRNDSEFTSDDDEPGLERRRNKTGKKGFRHRKVDPHHVNERSSQSEEKKSEAQRGKSKYARQVKKTGNKFGDDQADDVDDDGEELDTDQRSRQNKPRQQRKERRQNKKPVQNKDDKFSNRANVTDSDEHEHYGRQKKPGQQRKKQHRKEHVKFDKGTAADTSDDDDDDDFIFRRKKNPKEKRRSKGGRKLIDHQAHDSDHPSNSEHKFKNRGKHRGNKRDETMVSESTSKSHEVGHQAGGDKVSNQKKSEPQKQPQQKGKSSKSLQRKAGKLGKNKDASTDDSRDDNKSNFQEKNSGKQQPQKFPGNENASQLRKKHEEGKKHNRGVNTDSHLRDQSPARQQREKSANGNKKGDKYIDSQSNVVNSNKSSKVDPKTRNQETQHGGNVRTEPRVHESNFRKSGVDKGTEKLVNQKKSKQQKQQGGRSTVDFSMQFGKKGGGGKRSTADDDTTEDDKSKSNFHQKKRQNQGISYHQDANLPNSRMKQAGKSYSRNLSSPATTDQGLQVGFSHQQRDEGGKRIAGKFIGDQSKVSKASSIDDRRTNFGRQPKNQGTQYDQRDDPNFKRNKVEKVTETLVNQQQSKLQQQGGRSTNDVVKKFGKKGAKRSTSADHDTTDDDKPNFKQKERGQQQFSYNQNVSKSNSRLKQAGKSYSRNLSSRASATDHESHSRSRHRQQGPHHRQQGPQHRQQGPHHRQQGPHHRHQGPHYQTEKSYDEKRKQARRTNDNHSKFSRGSDNEPSFGQKSKNQRTPYDKGDEGNESISKRNTSKFKSNLPCLPPISQKVKSNLSHFPSSNKADRSHYQNTQKFKRVQIFPSQSTANDSNSRRYDGDDGRSRWRNRSSSSGPKYYTKDAVRRKLHTDNASATAVPPLCKIKFNDGYKLKGSRTTPNLIDRPKSNKNLEISRFSRNNYHHQHHHRQGETRNESQFQRRVSSFLDEPDVPINLENPQEIFFWVPLGRYSWEMRRVKVCKSQVLNPRETLGSKQYMGVVPEIGSRRSTQPSPSTQPCCFETDRECCCYDRCDFCNEKECLLNCCCCSCPL